MKNKFGRFFTKYVGTHRKSPKICVWVPKLLVTNVRGPKQIWVLKTKPKFVLQGYASGGSKWVIDSRCTNHMTRESTMFSTYEENDDPTDLISFGDNSQERVLGVGNMATSFEHFISKVFLFETLDYNLLSVSQLCNMGYNCIFNDEGVIVYRRSDGSIVFKGVLKGKLYVVDFTKDKAQLNTCLITKSNKGWLWHRRLAHVDMRNPHKLLKGDHVKASRPLIRVLVINDNGLWINNSF
jgi:hypothetical protein